MDFIKGNEQVKIDPNGIDISGSSNILLKSDGKVGIGTNSPQHPLQVNGSQAIFSNTPELLLFKQFGPGRMGPTLDWGNTDHTDWKIQADNTVLNILSGSSGVTTESITINNTGNVGIGTTTLDAKLTVYGEDSESTSSRLLLKVNDKVAAGEWTGIGLGGYASSTNGQVCKSAIIHQRDNNYGIGSLHLCTNNTGDTSSATKDDAKLTITSNGNVGIGTTNPSLKLTVGGSIITQSDNSSITVGNSSDSTTTTNSLRLHYTTGKNAYIDYNDTTTGLHIRSGSNNVMIFSPTGNVGIGTSNPEAKLDVKGSVYINDLNDAREFGLQLSRAGITGQLANSLVLNSRPNADDEGTLFQINGSTKMFLANSGNVGIGITNPDAQLVVRGSGSNESTTNQNGAIQILCGTTGKNIDGMAIKASNDGHHIINFVNQSGSLRGKIAGNNSLSVKYETTSDRRKKENIREMESMIDKVMAIKCRQFNWIEGKEEAWGFIAQEIYEVFPHERPDISSYCKYKCCDEEDDDEEDCCCYSNIDEPVDKEGKEYWYGLDYGHFTPYLCKALQESHTKVLSLEQRNNDLEQQVTSLSSRLEAVESILLSLQNN